ncbi:MAG: HAMP domain-containing protein [Pirellulales bacterium]|nr:HAMP domain-containing protein [Pirellulales bacterium]
MGIAIWLISIWAARRVSKPIIQFATAAEQFGRDINAPTLPETGSRELRQSIQAFNQMQERLRQLVNDPTFMLAAISHDLRTILTRLKLRAEFIEDPEQAQKAIADIDQMQAMLDETLSFAREDCATEGYIKVDLAELLQSLCDDFADAGKQATYSGPARLTYRRQPPPCVAP